MARQQSCLVPGGNAGILGGPVEIIDPKQKYAHGTGVPHRRRMEIPQELGSA